VTRAIYDCSNVKDVHGIENEIPTHGGYHYSSTAVEWYRLLSAMKEYTQTGKFNPEVSLEDGLAAVEIGLQATAAIVNEHNRNNHTAVCGVRPSSSILKGHRVLVGDKKELTTKIASIPASTTIHY